jgi:hypothetical protein
MHGRWWKRRRCHERGRSGDSTHDAHAAAGIQLNLCQVELGGDLG